MNPLDAFVANYNTTAQTAQTAQTADTGDTGNPLDEFVKNYNSTPEDIKKAQSDNLPMNPNTGNADYNGWCQSFVEQITGEKPPQPAGSAIQAWDSYLQNGKAIPSTVGLKPGDIIYFSPNASNEGFGHTGIYKGNNQMVSATDYGVQTTDLTDWQNMTGQQILGYIPQGGQ